MTLSIGQIATPAIPGAQHVGDFVFMFRDDMSLGVLASLTVINFAFSLIHLKKETELLKWVIAFQVITLLGGDTRYGQKRTTHRALTKALGLNRMASHACLVADVLYLGADVAKWRRKC